MADDFINGLGSSSVGGSQVGGADTDTTANQLRNQILSALVTVLQNAIPQATASVSSSASAGSATLPANPAAFLTITVGSTAYKIPLYNQ